MRELTYEEILELIKLFEASSEFSEFHLRFGDTVVDLRKHGAAGPPVGDGSASQMPEAQEAAGAAKAATETPVAATVSPEAFLIKSPTVGTFYCAPQHGATPFVTVGQRISPETTVCTVLEVMKLMNSIQAECSGVVSEILIQDGEPVEFGQTLMVVEQD